MAANNGRPPDAEPTDYRFVPYADFAARTYPRAEPLLGTRSANYFAASSLLMVHGPAGSSKSTWTIDGAVHLAAGVPWLGLAVPRPVRLGLIENEGPAALYQQKLDAKQQ